MTASSPSTTTDRAHRRATGFTLVEMAVVLTIIALLLGSLMYTLSAQVEQRSRSDTEQRLEYARDLLLSFALVNGRLPCPATSTSSGDESFASGSSSGGGTCTASAYYGGFLPAKAIGFQPVDSSGYAVDAWGNRIRYAVSATTWNSGAAMYTKTHVANTTAAWSLSQTPGDLVVCSQAISGTQTAGTGCTAGTSVTNQNTVVAIVFSIGKDGPTGTYGTNEQDNIDGDVLFVSRPPDPSTASGGEFDDMLVWIPVGLLYGKMISAGLLP